MKYEIFEVTKEDLKFEIGLMHSEQLTHADVAEAMHICLSTTYNTTFDGVKVVAAGFCSAGLPVKCWGHSESLNMSTRGDIDELVLMQTNLNFENVYDSDFDKINNVLRNFSQTCHSEVGRQIDKLFVVSCEIPAYGLLEDDSAIFEEGMILRYKGPTINRDGKAAHLFTVAPASMYYADFDGIYSVEQSMLRGVLHDSPLARKVAKLQSCAIVVNGEPQVVNLHSVLDPFPLTVPHDQMIVIYVPLGGGEQQKFVGTLEQIAEFLNLNGD